MEKENAPRGLWLHRSAIHFFTLMLGILFFWILGFLVKDIKDIPGTEYRQIEQKHLDQALLKRHEELQRKISELQRGISNQKEKQRIVQESGQNFRQTINQLLELKKVGIEKGRPLPETEDAEVSSTLKIFIETQRKYQEYSQAVSEMLEQEQNLGWEAKKIAEVFEEQRKTAREEFQQVSSRHRLKLAFLQLGVLLPILAAAALLISKKRSSIYFPLYLAFGSAVLLKVALVVHEYFPGRYFKYILIGGLLLVVARLLIFFIRLIAFPRIQWLLRQYREAYEKFLCPVCEYPIRTGPRRFLFWTRRSVAKIIVHSNPGEQEESYTCPNCGKTLFEECGACRKIRPALLPYCPHCGKEKSL